MRILRLTFAGIGPYRHEQHVDFERLEDDGIYLIAGKTGSGKSTILDAICFALYGSVPRFEGTQAHMRSDHSGPGDHTFATVEWEAGDRTFRVTRSPEYERPAKRGGGMTRQAAKVQMLELVDGEWTGISTSAREIGTEVARVVGLTKDQFLQVILLAQNRFQEFLLAKNDERQALLRTLFGTERFDRVRVLLNDKRKELGGELDAQRAILDQTAAQIARAVGIEAPDSPDAEWFRERGEAFAPRVADAQQRADAAETRHVAAAAERATAQQMDERQRRLRAARVEAAALDARESTIDGQRAELAAARRADALWAQLGAETAALAALAAAETAAAAAEAAYRAALPAALPDVLPDVLPDAASPARTDPAATDPAATDPATQLQRLAELIGSLEPARADESRIADDRTAVARAHDELETRDTALAVAAQRLAELPAKIIEADDSVRRARELAVLVDARRASLDSIVARRRAAIAVGAARVAQTERAGEHLALVQGHADAAREHERLVTARFHGFAAELADTLTPGDPCAVCGSTEHPAPARLAEPGDAVTPQQITAAREQMAKAQVAMDAAQRDAHRATERVAVLSAEAGDRDEAALAADEAEARALLGAAEAARAEAETAEATRDALRAEHTAAGADMSARREVREVAALALAAMRADLAARASRVEVARGSHESVAERIAALSERRALTERYRSAVDERAAAVTSAAAATTAVETQLAERGFSSRASARSAHRETAAMTELDHLIAEFDRQRAATSALLYDPDLANLPADPVDLAGPTAALSAAVVDRDAALAELATLRERDQQVRERVTEAVDRLAASAERNLALDQLRALAETIDGKGPNTKRMDLESFVLAARLEEIVDAANARLRTMTSGRYALEHDDSLAFRAAASGLGVIVSDAFTGMRRQPTSLSGGETFLASLALALGLADVVTAHSGGIALDTMFIDEGFGSLDPETLEIAMSTLDGLRAGGRTVGLISHVDAMKERIRVGIQVAVTDTGASTLSQETPATPA